MIARFSLRSRACQPPPSDRADTMRASSMPARSAMASTSSNSSSSRAPSAPRPLLRLRTVRSLSKKATTPTTPTSSRLGLSHPQASSAASFVARANDEEDEGGTLVVSGDNSKSLSSSAAASARAAAEAPSPPLSATRQAPLPSASSDERRKLSPLASLARAAGVLYRFSRPHTMIGTTISILSVSALALVRAQRALGTIRKEKRLSFRRRRAAQKIRKKKLNLDKFSLHLSLS